MTHAPVTTEWFRQNLFSQADDRERQSVQHQAFKPSFVAAFEHILQDYDLAQQFGTAKLIGEKLNVLEIGCGEGLYLHDIAAAIETHGLIKAVNLIGIDVKVAAISTAEEFCKLSNPPRPYLNFLVEDFARPLDEATSLRMIGGNVFDFIYGLLKLENLPDPRQHLLNWYGALRPGGSLYMRTMVTHKGSDGWLSIHPALEKLGQIGMNFVVASHDGADLPVETSTWLKEAGAEQVETRLVILPTGGNTQIGVLMARNSLMIVRNMAPLLIKKGLITQQYFEEVMASLYQNASPNMVGQMAFVDISARKPL